jgi:hypothetical protein
MGTWNTFADRHFARDETGRLVFFPRGSRGTAYFVNATDAEKIKPMLKIYAVAAALINLTGSTASMAITLWLVFDAHPASVAAKLRFGAMVYAISASLLYYGPALLLWKVFRGYLDELSSSLTKVDPSSLRLTDPPLHSNRALVLVLVAGFLLLGLGIFFAISWRH